MATLQFQVNAVRHAVSSSATCTPATVVSLKALLLPRDHCDGNDLAPSSTQTSAATRSTRAPSSTSRPGTVSSSRPGTAAAKRRPPPIRDDARHETETRLSDKEKAQLATHIINAALKVLTEAAKPGAAVLAQPPIPSTAPETPGRAPPLDTSAEADTRPSTVARRALRRSSSMTMTPLQPRTLNRVSTSPTKPVSKPPSPPTNSHAACLATVECARVAFAALRVLQDAGHVALPALQLEAGLSSFVAKLLGLNMLDHACRELRMLKRRLQRFAPSSDDVAVAVGKPKRTAPKTAKSSQAMALTSASTSAASLPNEILDYGDTTGAPTAVAKLIVASQLHALRILAALKKPSYTEAALPFLRTACPSSPLNLLLDTGHTTGDSPMDRQKALRQLDTLAQLLLALTPSVSSKDDASALEANLSIRPAAALELQTLSLETRLRSWTLSGRSGDADTDIISPLSRCLLAYVRRCRAANKPPAYTVCRSRIDHIQSILEAGGLSTAHTSRAPMASIYQTLSVVARETGYLDDAVHWATQLAGLSSTTEDSAARRCSTSAYLVALQLRNTERQPLLPQSSTLLADVLEAIKGSLKGDTTELEELLANVCLVRKAAVNLLVAPLPKTKLPPSTRPLLEAFVLQCPRFCLRWLGKPPTAKSNSKDFLRYEQRRKLLTQSIRHTLDSAFVVTKANLEKGFMAWEQLDSILGDALTVLEYLGEPRVVDAAASYHVKISHFYYMCYTALRRGSSDQGTAVRALQRSIDCVKHRPGAEKEKAQLILKLERMADLRTSAGQIGDALGALQTIRSSLIEDGVLADVVSALDRQPPRLAWTASEQAEVLGRSLVSIHRLEQVHVDWAAGLDELEQAAVLEHQLHFICRARRTSNGSGYAAAEQQNLDLSHLCVEVLLRIYCPTRFPIRRLRTLLRVFSANIDTPSKVAEIAPQITAVLGLITTQGLACDTSLDGCLQHYRTLATSLVGFSEGYVDADTLQASLSTWQSLVAASTTQTDLEHAVDNVDDFQTHLRSMVEFLRAMGRDAVLTTVLELSTSVAKIVSRSTDATHDAALALSSHYVRLGDCRRAERILDQLQNDIQQAPWSSAETRAGFHLCFAEYLLAMGRVDEAHQHVISARPASSEDEASSAQTKRNRADGARRRRLGAQACLFQSIVALEKGDMTAALQNARNGVRVLFHDWNRLEASVRNVLSSSGEGESSAGEKAHAYLGASLRDAAADEQSSLLLPDTSMQSVGPTLQTAASPAFWVLFHPLFDSIMRLSFVYAHLGLFQETVYYAEQAYKLAAVTNAALSLAQAEAWQGTVWRKAGKLDKGLVFASQARCRLPDMDQTSHKAALACELSSFYRDAQDDAAEQDMLHQAEIVLEHMASADGANCASSASQEKTQTTARRPTTKTKAKTAKTARPSTRRTGKATKQAAATCLAISLTAPPATDNATVVGLRAALLAQNVVSLLTKKDWSGALVILRAAGVAPDHSGEASPSRTALPRAAADVLAERVALASCLLGSSTEQMADDAVFSVLQDSTLSFPAISSAPAAEISGRLPGPKSPVVVSKARGGTAVSARAAKATAGFVDMLEEAQDCLVDAQSLAAVSGDTSTLHLISSMLQSVVLILSATSWGRPRALGHPGYASCAVELARNMTWRRERRAMLVEKAAAAQAKGDGDSSWWPAVSLAAVPVAALPAVGGPFPETPKRRASMVGGGGLSPGPVASISSDLSIGRFQRDYIDIIPKDWSVVSLALTESKHDLCITKLQAGHSPFVIRLPLERAISRDADTEVFDFQQGRKALLEIVEAINASCHDARDMTAKGAKAAWWTERETLDGQLKELLDNMEQIWLGGFRGIFSQHVRRPALFARFQKAFQAILNKHLPSRRAPARGKRKTAGKAASAAVALDPRVLDLFLGLGDATVDGCDFDDALDDLLYFVVDILQFHGERNAYDEIDFDAMVVETFEALFAYHAGVRDSDARHAQGGGGPNDVLGHRHTILVLDKSLHVFPWEALPCMQASAVSRVPSLACLRRLISEQQQQQEEEERKEAVADTEDFDELCSEPVEQRRSGYRASAASGAYMLNPSGDLSTTEATFDSPLTTGLRGAAWTRIVGRAPTEEEFAAVLQDKDVLLYFGHGSGAQYIRGRTVRKLERCRATALLMGCSSAGLDYNGAFELHGPVWNYMLAGCPAVVGTLWDVTDKDIDRFAGRTFEEWGLVPRGSFGAAEESSASNKRGAARPTSAVSALSASLVEAVVRARSAPRFRYLTAAAVCVYGIPVYLH